MVNINRISDSKIELLEDIKYISQYINSYYNFQHISYIIADFRTETDLYVMSHYFNNYYDDYPFYLSDEVDFKNVSTVIDIDFKTLNEMMR